MKFVKNMLTALAFKTLKIDQEFFNNYKSSYYEKNNIEETYPSLFAPTDYAKFSKMKKEADNCFVSRFSSTQEFCRININNSEKTDQSGVVLAARTNSFSIYSNQLSNFINNYTGTGTTLDMGTYDVRLAPMYQFQQLETTFYQTSPIAKRLIDLLTSSCLAEGIDLTSKSEKQETQIKEVEEITGFMRKKSVDQIFYGSVKKMFMHGGCAIYLKVPGDQAQPYYPKKGDKVEFISIDKSLMFPSGFFDLLNIGTPDFNHPTHWTLIFNPATQAKSTPIHASRFIFLIPEELPFFARINALWWGNSVLLCVREIINLVERSFRSTGNQVSQASMAILKTSLRNKAVNPKTIKNQNAQFQAALTQNGSVNAFDINDIIERLEVGNLKTQAEATKIIQSLVCTAYGIPWSIFDSYPIGGTTASDADLLIWYKQVMLHKKNYIEIPLTRLIEVISTIIFGKDDLISFKFHDPNAPSALQEADISLKIAQRDTMYSALGLPAPFIFREVARQKLYPDLTQEEADKIITPVEGSVDGTPMEAKDVKDDLNRTKQPTKSVSKPSPESVTKAALYK